MNLDLITTEEGLKRQCCQCRNGVCIEDNLPLLMEEQDKIFLYCSDDVTHSYCSHCYEDIMREVTKINRRNRL